MDGKVNIKEVKKISKTEMTSGYISSAIMPLPNHQP
jgi:hypothetical protein